MALQTNALNQTKIIGHSNVQPFLLELKEGSGYGTKTKQLNFLSTSPDAAIKACYTIKEFQRLELFLTAAKPETHVSIIWNKIYDGNDSEDSIRFELNLDTQSSYILFDFIQHKNEEYPWRCGFYHFEISYEDQVFYGGFQIIPKNLAQSQFSKMNELIQTQLEGLTTDYVNQKRTHGVMNEIKDHSWWRFYTWYKQKETNILNTIKTIENSILYEWKKSYAMEAAPKRQDIKSVRWENTFKGSVYKGDRYLNKTYVQNIDTEMNRMTKYRVKMLIQSLDKSYEFFSKINNELVKQINSEWNSANLLEQKRSSMDSRRTTTSDQNRFETDMFVHKKSAQQLETEKKEVLHYIKSLKESKRSLLGTISTAFWNEISLVPPKRISIGRDKSHILFNKLWSQYLKLNGNDVSEQGSIIPVYKPTPLLYEYYVYFMVITSLKEIGWSEGESSLKEQLMKTFFKDGLKNGTSVELRKEDSLVRVVYDEHIQPNADLALEKGVNLYSGGIKRTPDIRIDLYHTTHDEEIYQSSFIVEVKYSPFHNIYQKVGKTRAMEQMNDYWNIKYVYLRNGKKRYKHNVIEEVVCVYPGGSNEVALKTEECGNFLQLYPKLDSKDIYDIAGKAEFRILIEDWINR